MQHLTITGVLNQKSVNPSGSHECVSGVFKSKINQETPLFFVHPFGPLFSLIEPQL